MVVIALLLGGYFRFHPGVNLPGLEHDESLILLGARSIAQGQSVPLTGDKVYEGPLLEYSIALAMRLTEMSVDAARSVMAMAGMTAILFIFLAGKNIGTPVIGGAAAMLLAVSPWALATSRVIYACNLSPLFISMFIYFITRYLATDKWMYVCVIGMTLGLTANGRFTALILIIPVLFLRMNKHQLSSSIRHFLCLSTPIFAIVFPVLIYNAWNRWPAADVLLGRSQGFLIRADQGIISGYIHRIAGYGITLWETLDGTRFWLDVELPGTPTRSLIPFLMMTGCLCLVIAIMHYRSRSLIWFGCTTVFIGLTIPLFIKENAGDLIRFHPHYLDLIFPFVVILTALPIGFLCRFPKFSVSGFIAGCILLLMAVGSQLPIIHQMVDRYQSTGGPGRWNRCYETASQQIAVRFSSQNTVVAMKWSFGAGYPQMKFLLPEFSVIPYLEECPGYYGPEGQLLPVQIITVADRSFNRDGLWTASTELNLPSDNPLLVWTRRSPGIRIAGKIRLNDGSQIPLSLHGSMDDDRAWHSTGTISFPSEPPQSITIVSRQDLFQQIPQIAALIPKVTPRHRSELERLSHVAVVHRVACEVAPEDTIQLQWVDRDKYWEITMNRSGHAITGIWDGEALFY